MRIHYMSDIHCEFGALDKPLPKGDILILAGDITLISVQHPHMADWHHTPDIKKATDDLFQQAARNFDRVVYFPGNHEAYGCNLDQFAELMQPAVHGATLLQDSAIEIATGILLFGGTLWTDFDRNTPSVHRNVGWGMNDFRLIKHTKRGKVEPFTTKDAYSRHRKCRQALHTLASEHPDHQIIVATHHAPSMQGNNPMHGGGLLDHGYASDMELFIKKRPNITHWVHGHTHIQRTYQVHQCQVMANCRGYVGREGIARTFNPDTYFEV